MQLWGTAALALVARVAVVAWAAPRIPPAADGTFYHRIAERIAAGHGYTWLWPDGAVTYAAHYPVGYPALAGALYAAFGSTPGVAMALNALLGTAAAVAVHAAVLRYASPRRARAAGALVALHPALLLYTPALMTEGVTAALLAIAAWCAARSRDGARTGRDTGRDTGTVTDTGTDTGWGVGGRRARILRLVVLGLVLGVATLVRPQSLLLAPAFGALAWAPWGWRRAALGAGLATLMAVAVCAPWTVRNCVRMESCALVSVNGGWNLLIGADPAGTGAWSPVQVPDACREVWDEAAKDACFAAAARRVVAAEPLAWLARAPRKLAATFDYCGAAGWYLHEAAPAAVPAGAKVALGVVETLLPRARLVAALVWAAAGLRARAARRSRGVRAVGWAALGVGVVAALCPWGWVGYLALLALAALRGRDLWAGPVLPAAAVATLALTMATHAVFFGAGRYALVAVPFLCALACAGFEGADGARGRRHAERRAVVGAEAGRAEAGASATRSST
ncbi:MAG: hypothetical protein WKG00_06320 [Polyangiaceae bacterium]